MRPSDVYPRVVPLSSFNLPKNAGAQPRLERFGIIHELGHGVAWLLVSVNGNLVRNLNAEDLGPLGLTKSGAEKLAFDNLCDFVAGGESFTGTITRTPAGHRYIVWTGNWLTASCILWPGLFGWARKLLETDEILVGIPHEQMMFIFSTGDAEFRTSMRQYSQAVVSSMEKRITAELFTLRPEGVLPFTEPQAKERTDEKRNTQ